MGSKSSPSTDTSGYAALYDALSSQSATSAAESQASLDWSKQQWLAEEPYTVNYMNAMIDATNAETTAAQNQQSFYDTTYKPIEAQFAQTATGYNTPERAQQQSAAAQADVAASYSQQRQSALQNLESYGIDPSQTRYGALDLGARISQAGAQAAAGTQSRLNTEATGLALEGEAINTGRGYSSNIAQAYSTATNAGSSGVNAGLNTSSTYGNLMGTPIQWGSLSTNQANSASNTINTAYSNELAGFNASNAVAENTSSGIGSLVGAAGIGAAIII